MALISKILEDTLTAGNTYVIFTDADIPNSLIRVYTTDSNIYPTTVELSGTSITATFEAQSSNIGVALEIVKSGISVIDDILTQDSDNALSANQGYVLSNMITSVSNSIPDNITDLDDINITSIQDGQILSWDDTKQKFVNVDNSASSEEVYSTTEQQIGTWVDGSTLFMKTIDFGTLPNSTSKSVSHGITNLDYICEIVATTQNENTKDVLPLPFVNRANLSSQIQMSVSATDVTIITATNQNSYTKTFVTLKYTKTS